MVVSMTKDEALQMCLEYIETDAHERKYVRHAIKAALEAKDEPVQVSPLQFVEMVMEKEHLVGKPIIWAEWPNKEKNT
jgi:hypothetical protein